MNSSLIFKIKALLEGANHKKLVPIVAFIEGITETPQEGELESEIKAAGTDAKGIALAHLCYALAPLHPTEAKIALDLCEIYVIDKEKPVETY